MKEYNIAVIAGDGTGPEVIREGIKVLNASAKKNNFLVSFNKYDFGGERYLKTGKILDDSESDELRKFDAIYLGAIGHPDVKPGILEKGILLKIRFDLDQYINLRPVKLYQGVDCPLKDKKPEDIDFAVVRENTAGLYKGEGELFFNPKGEEIATQVMRYTTSEVERCLRYAFNLARDRNKRKQLTLVHKTNVLTNCGDLWMRAFEKMGKEFPDIKRDYNHVDACCMWMVKNPEFYDVIVTENMFGDIITDLGAIIQGGMGIAAGGNINPEGVSMFEPIGGSAPKYAGKNVINPLAAIEAGRMMLEHLDEKKAARNIEEAVSIFLRSGQIKGLSVQDIKDSNYSTSKIGDWLVDYVLKGK